MTEDDQAEGEELYLLLLDRLDSWANGDSDVAATADGIDLGTAAAFASTHLHITTRTLLADAAAELHDDPDTNEIAHVRLVDLIAQYYDGDHVELPDGDG